MLDILCEEMFFAHPANHPPIHVGNMTMQWDREQIRFTVTPNADFDAIDDLITADEDAARELMDRWAMRFMLFSTLADEVAAQLMRHVMSIDYLMSDDDAHLWSYNMLIHIVSSTPRDALNRVGMNLINIDRDERWVAFG